MKKRTNYKKLWQEAVQLNDYIITTGMRRLDTEERTDVVGETLQYYIKGTAKSALRGVRRGEALVDPPRKPRPLLR